MLQAEWQLVCRRTRARTTAQLRCCREGDRRNFTPLDRHFMVYRACSGDRLAKQRRKMASRSARRIPSAFKQLQTLQVLSRAELVGMVRPLRITRERKRCIMSGRSTALYGEYRVCRQKFYKLCRQGEIRGVQPATWWWKGYFTLLQRLFLVMDILCTWLDCNDKNLWHAILYRSGGNIRRDFLWTLSINTDAGLFKDAFMVYETSISTQTHFFFKHICAWT